jgi:protein TonB
MAMSSPLPAFDNYEQTAELLDREPDNVIQLKQSTDSEKPAALTTAIGSFKNLDITRDNKLLDYLVLGILSILVHNSVIDHFKGVSFAQEIVPLAKPENKVQITLTRPQPKPIAPPPPQVITQPPVPKVVPLKPQKPKPVKKVVEQQEPTPTPSPVVDSAPAATGPVSNAQPVVEEKNHSS